MIRIVVQKHITWMNGVAIFRKKTANNIAIGQRVQDGALSFHDEITVGLEDRALKIECISRQRRERRPDHRQ